MGTVKKLHNKSMDLAEVAVLERVKGNFDFVCSDGFEIVSGNGPIIFRDVRLRWRFIIFTMNNMILNYDCNWMKKERS